MPLTKPQQRRWKALIKYLHEEQPLALPTHVWRVAYRNDLGSFGTDGEQNWIKIAARLDWSDALYALAEEWGHALMNDAGHPPTGDYATDHTGMAGMAEYAVRAAINEFLEEGG